MTEYMVHTRLVRVADMTTVIESTLPVDATNDYEARTKATLLDPTVLWNKDDK